VQLLQANFPPSEADADANFETDSTEPQWPAFGSQDEFSTDHPIVAIAWLSQRSLAYLDSSLKLVIVDTVMMTIQDRINLENSGIVSSTIFTNSKSFHSAIQTDPGPSGGLTILSTDSFQAISLLSFHDRIKKLADSGEWLEALALTLDHYETSIKSLEDKKSASFSSSSSPSSPSNNLPVNHPSLSANAVRSPKEVEIASWLNQYITLAFDNAPKTHADSHFAMLAGVCIDFCVITKRLDLLYGEIFRRFQKFQVTAIFVDLLEPYVLNDRLTYIAPEPMAAFVEHCSHTGELSKVERCLLHMDVKIMDFDSVLKLLKKNGMFSALLHVFNYGLDEFVAPLELLIERLFDVAEKSDVYRDKSDGQIANIFEKHGYKALLYLKHCSLGRRFPQYDLLLPESRQGQLFTEIVGFLSKEDWKPTTSNLQRTKWR